MENKVAEQDPIDQVNFTDESEEEDRQFETLGDFLDHIELGVRAFIRAMVQQYAEDEFLRYIGARPYERPEEG